MTEICINRLNEETRFRPPFRITPNYHAATKWAQLSTISLCWNRGRRGREEIESKIGPLPWPDVMHKWPHFGDPTGLLSSVLVPLSVFIGHWVSRGLLPKKKHCGRPCRGSRDVQCLFTAQLINPFIRSLFLFREKMPPPILLHHMACTRKGTRISTSSPRPIWPLSFLSRIIISLLRATQKSRQRRPIMQRVDSLYRRWNLIVRPPPERAPHRRVARVDTLTSAFHRPPNVIIGHLCNLIDSSKNFPPKRPWSVSSF